MPARRFALTGRVNDALGVTAADEENRLSLARRVAIHPSVGLAVPGVADLHQCVVRGDLGNADVAGLGDPELPAHAVLEVELHGDALVVLDVVIIDDGHVVDLITEAFTNGGDLLELKGVEQDYSLLVVSVERHDCSNLSLED